MTKEEFKQRWESDDNGGGITFDDIVTCAKDWGLFLTPRILEIELVRYQVLRAANTNDCEQFNPENNADDEMPESEIETMIYEEYYREFG
jgi:hypothetical protein